MLLNPWVARIPTELLKFSSQGFTQDRSLRLLANQGTFETERPVACLTVAIATVDRPCELRRCLNALLAGEVLPAEIIVVDQSQEDATRIAVEESKVKWERANPCRKTSVVYLRQQARGLSVSRNLAFAQASFPVVAVTDDDCVPDAKWVSAINQVFSALNPPAAMGGRVLSLGEAVPNSYAVASRTSRIPAEFRGKVPPWVAGSGGNFAVAREWWKSLGHYDERLGVGSPGRAAEDMDFIYKVLRAGATVKYNPNAVVYHERQTQSRRLETCSNYGFGIGSFCGKWLRHGDYYVLWILGQWLLWNSKRLLFAMARHEHSEVPQRALVLKGTVLGLAYGFRKLRSDL